MPKKKKAKNKKKNHKDLPGIALEKAVARIQQLLDPNSSVTHNETLEDRLGNKRQFDVVIRGQVGGWPMLGVIECKDHSRKKGLTDVEAFVTKTDHLRANFRMMVSKKGFTKSALILAKHENIRCLSLLHDPEQVGFMIGHWWYGLIRRWTDARLAINFAPDTLPVAAFKSESVKWQGMPVVDWFIKELLTTFDNLTNVGDYCLRIDFDEVRMLEVEGKQYPVKALSCLATRVFKRKRKWVNWTGDAFYDWHEGKLIKPGGGTLVGSAVETDVSLWDDYQGQIPEPGKDEPQGFFSVTALSIQKWDGTKTVVDLAKLGAQKMFPAPT